MAPSVVSQPKPAPADYNPFDRKPTRPSPLGKSQPSATVTSSSACLQEVPKEVPIIPKKPEPKQSDFKKPNSSKKAGKMASSPSVANTGSHGTISNSTVSNSKQIS